MSTFVPPTALISRMSPKKVGCSVCHPQKSKKTRNHYGAALQEALDKKNEKNKARIKDALKKIENDSCPGSGQKWIERLEEEKTALSQDIREVYSEAKGAGFDPKVMRQVVRLRKMESADRAELEALLDTYMAALE